MIIGKAIVVHDMGWIQANLAQNMFAIDTLVPEVVQCEADTRMAHAQALIDLVEEDGNERGLPIVAVDNVRVLIRLEHEFQCRAAEESKALNIVILAVKNFAIEKIVRRMRINEETFQPFHEPKVNVAMNPLVMVRNPKIAVGFGEAPDTIVTHAIIFGKNHLDRVATNPQFSRETLHDVTEAADFCGGSALGGDHYDEHNSREALKG
jgi:hypothetical protein